MVGVYASVAAGLTAAASGQYFYVVDATNATLGLYLDSAGVAVLQGDLRSLRSFITEKEYESFGTGFHGVVSNSGTLATISNDVVTAQVNADISFEISLAQAGLVTGDTVSFSTRVRSGTPINGATPAFIVEQRNGANVVIGAAMTLQKVGDYWIAEKLVVDATAANIRLRHRNTSGAGVVVFERPTMAKSPNAPVVRTEPRAVLNSILSFVDGWAQSNLFADQAPINIIGTTTRAGSSYSVPAAAVLELSTAIAAAGIAIGDTVTVLLKATASPGAFVSIREMLTGAGVSFGTDRYMSRVGITDYFTATLVVGSLGGGTVDRLRVRVDNRNGNAGSSTAVPITISDITLVKGTMPSPRAIPAAVRALISSLGSGRMYVDGTTGSDANDGSIGAPKLTLGAAIAAGATSISARVGTYRESLTVPATGLEIIATRQSGDTADYVSIYSSNLRASGDFTATGGSFPNLFQRAEAVDPGGVWEVVAGVATRLGVLTPSGAPKLRMANSLTEANTTPGSWRFEAGMLYVHPYGSTITGKSYEVPNAQYTVNVTGAAVFRTDGVLMSYGRENSLFALRTVVRLQNSIVQSSGSSDGYAVQEALHFDNNCTFRDAGDDGLNTNGQVVGASNGSKFNDNMGDGYAPHSNEHDLVLAGCEMLRNGKQGFVSIATGSFRLFGCRSEQNRDLDYLMSPNAGSAASIFEMTGCKGGATQLDNGTATVTANIKDFKGASVASNVTLANLEAIDVRGGLNGIRCDGGVMNVTNFKARKHTTAAIRLTAGTLTLKDGHALRSATGLLQSGGTLVLDNTDPVNVFGNGTQFSGVSAPDQALTLSFQAI